MTVAASLAVGGGIALVLLSIAGGPVWLRVGLIVLGAVLGMAGLAELAGETLADAYHGQPGPERTSSVSPPSAARPARPPA